MPVTITVFISHESFVGFGMLNKWKKRKSCWMTQVLCLLQSLWFHSLLMLFTVMLCFYIKSNNKIGGGEHKIPKFPAGHNILNIKIRNKTTPKYSYKVSVND